MSEIIINILSVVVTSIILPIITYIGIRVSKWLNTKIEDEKQRKILETITDIVTRNVSTVFQTYVETLKDNNKFDDEAKERAFDFAKLGIVKELTEESVAFIKENYGDINNWLASKIESTIYNLKK